MPRRPGPQKPNAGHFKPGNKGTPKPHLPGRARDAIRKKIRAGDWDELYALIWDQAINDGCLSSQKLLVSIHEDTMPEGIIDPDEIKTVDDLLPAMNKVLVLAFTGKVTVTIAERLMAIVMNCHEIIDTVQVDKGTKEACDAAEETRRQQAKRGF